MKEIGKILLYLVATVVLGALLAPPLYRLGQDLLHWGAHHGWVSIHTVNGAEKATGRLAFLHTHFRRYFDRAILISAFLLLIPLIRSLRIGGWSGLGLQRNPRRFSDFLAGLLISTGSVAVLGFIAVYAGHYSMAHPVPWHHLAWLPLTALAVACVEELLFRGAIQGIVQRGAPAGVAVVFVSARYAIVHFLKPENTAGPAHITWSSGFSQASHALAGFENPMLVLGGFSTLFLVGAVLGYARYRTRSLWMPVGLHAGWIIAKMGFNQIARHHGTSWPWFGPELLVGLAPAVAVACAGITAWWWLRRRGAG